jgi:hypothetical protein
LAGAVGRRVDAYDTYLHKGGPIAKDLKPVRNVKPLWSKYGLLGGSSWVASTCGWAPHAASPVRHDAHGKSDAAATGKAKNFKPIDYPKPDGVLSFDRLTNVSFSMTNHEESQPAHLTLKDADNPIKVNLPNMPSRRSGIARPESTRWSRRMARTRASSSTSRTASTARPAISRTQRRTSTGPCPRAATGRTIPTCDADSRGAAGIPARIRVAHETVTANLAA